MASCAVLHFIFHGSIRSVIEVNNFFRYFVPEMVHPLGSKGIRQLAFSCDTARDESVAKFTKLGHNKRSSSAELSRMCTTNCVQMTNIFLGSLHLPPHTRKWHDIEPNKKGQQKRTREGKRNEEKYNNKKRKTA